MVQQEAARLVQQGEFLPVQEEPALVPLQGPGLELGTGSVDLLPRGACLAVSLSQLLSLWVQDALESRKFQV